ncbi:MAG: alkaline phosphatase family protein [Candidatus Hydrogenedentes bacterium]|nr:alkaline phosphatase family protein [Candidatus Hydrogenedentota bacterium]
MSVRVLALSVETASPEAIDRGCADRFMPNLSALRERGAYGPLESVSNISSGSIWPSMYTGCMPSKHGIANFHMHFVNGTYHIDRYGPNQVMRPAVWDHLAKAGKRSIVMDVPLTRPHPGMNGIMISAWGVEGPAWRRQTHPPNLLSQLDRQFGPYPLPNDDYRRSIRSTELDKVRELRDILFNGMRLKTRVLKHLMKTEPWDLVLGVFSETHWADHVMYHVIDPAHPDYRPVFKEEFGSFFEDLFALQDDCIGGLIDGIDDDVVVLVFSGSGVRPSYYGNHLLPDVLDRLGYGSGPGGLPANEATAESAKTWSYYRIRQIQDTVSTPVIMTLKKLAPTRLWEKWTRRLIFAREHWADSRAFCLPNDYCGSIRINLDGREPNGKVRKDEYDAVCAELSSELLALENPDTGAPAVEAVLNLRELYPGEHADRLPDLSVVWSDKHPIRALRSPRVGTVRGENPERRPGAHSNVGFLTAAGRGIRAGAPLENARLIDLAPTVLHAIGIDPGEEMDGRPLPLWDRVAVPN